MSVDFEFEPLLTLDEVSGFLQVQKSYIYSLTHRNKIPHFKIGGHLRFRKNEVLVWLEAHKQEVCDVSIQEEV